MLSHVSIGVKDLAKARGFYDAALKTLGYKCLVEGGEYAGRNEDQSGNLVEQPPGKVSSTIGANARGTAAEAATASAIL